MSKPTKVWYIFVILLSFIVAVIGNTINSIFTGGIIGSIIGAIISYFAVKKRISEDGQ